MTVIHPTTREIRYEQRCSKKMIENQKGQRLDRYEKRCALRDEAKACVSLELNDRIQNQDRNQNNVRVQKKVRSSPRNLTVYGFFGTFF